MVKRRSSLGRIAAPPAHLLRRMALHLAALVQLGAIAMSLFLSVGMYHDPLLGLVRLPRSPDRYRHRRRCSAQSGGGNRRSWRLRSG